VFRFAPFVSGVVVTTLNASMNTQPSRFTEAMSAASFMSNAALHLISSWNRNKGIVMNVKQIAIAISILASATGAMAVEATQWNPPAGQLSRAEVKAEVARASANGELEARGEAYAGYFDVRTTTASTLARTEVKQELAQARANGELASRGEAYGGFPEVHPREGGQVYAWVKAHTTRRSVN